MRHQPTMGEWGNRGRKEWMQSWVEWERGQGTDSPTTPLLKEITASTTSHNCPQQKNQVIEEVGETRKVAKQTIWQHMGFSPINQGLTSPTPYPLEPCPFHSTLHYRSWLWFILFDVCVYMMPNYNVLDSTTYHRQLFLLPKHSQPNRWWGFCLELLTMINYIIYIMQTGSKPGCDIVTERNSYGLGYHNRQL